MYLIKLLKKYKNYKKQLLIKLKNRNIKANNIFFMNKHKTGVYNGKEFKQIEGSLNYSNSSKTGDFSFTRMG